MTDQPKLYTDLASWWHLLPDPVDYADEAAFCAQALTDACVQPPRTLLELGSGGGNNVSHLKKQLLTDSGSDSIHQIVLNHRMCTYCAITM